MRSRLSGYIDFKKCVLIFYFSLSVIDELTAMLIFLLLCLSLRTILFFVALFVRSVPTKGFIYFSSKMVKSNLLNIIWFGSVKIFSLSFISWLWKSVWFFLSYCSLVRCLHLCLYVQWCLIVSSMGTPLCHFIVIIVKCKNLQDYKVLHLTFFLRAFAFCYFCYVFNDFITNKFI